MFACEMLIQEELRKGCSNMLALKKVKVYYKREIESLKQLIKKNEYRFLDPDDETDIYDLQDREEEYQKKWEFLDIQLRKVERKIKLERELSKLSY